MPLFSVLMRLLLCLALVLNGATAAAMPHLHGPKSSQVSVKAQSPVKQAAVTDMPCHSGRTQATPASELSAVVDPAPPSTPHATQDCCESGACQCACMQVAHAALPTVPAAVAFLDRSHGLDLLASGHVAPTLPHLIRPPIG